MGCPCGTRGRNCPGLVRAGTETRCVLHAGPCVLGVRRVAGIGMLPCPNIPGFGITSRVGESSRGPSIGVSASYS